MSEIPDDKPLTAGDLREILRARSRLGKNGETWAQYFREKWLTPQNILLAVLAVFTVGGRVQEMQTGVAGAVDLARKATEAQTQLLREIGTLSQAVDSQQKAVEAQQRVIEAQREMFATKANLEALADRVRLNITRREFQEFQRTVVPSLQRIENSVKP